MAQSFYDRRKGKYLCVYLDVTNDENKNTTTFGSNYYKRQL